MRSAARCSTCGCRWSSSSGIVGITTGTADGQWIDSVASFLEPTLKAWNLPYEMLETDDEISCISRAFKTTEATSLPAAILLIGHAT